MQSSGNDAGLSVLQLRSRIQEKLGANVRIVEALGAHGSESWMRAHDDLRRIDLFVLAFTGGSAAAPEAYRRFEQRAESAARLDHPDVAPVGPLQEGDDLAYYVVPGAGGKSLDTLLDNEGPLPLDRTITILRGVASALDYAHRQGVVHGHLQPSLIGIRPNGAVMVSGFGLGTDGSIWRSGRSLAYMAPEQWQPNAMIDGSVDVYALGVIAFEMIVGRRRAISHSAKGVAMVDPLPIAHDTPLRKGSGLHVNQAVLRAVSKRPSARFATAEEFVNLLEGRSYSPASGLPTQRPTVDGERRSPFALVPMLLVAFVGIGLGFLAAPTARRTLRESGHFSAITDWFDAGPNFSAASGYSAPSGSGSSRASSFGNSTNSSSSSGASSSQSLFPGAATAGGGGTTGSSTGPVSAAATPSTAPASQGSNSGGGTTAPGTTPDVSQPTAIDSSGFVRIELDGGSAIVLIDGIPRGRTPYVGALHAGSHSVRVLSTSSVQPSNRQILVHPGDTTITGFSVAPATP